MHETRDLGIKWRQWHTLMFEEQVKVDLRVVCPQDVAKHECEDVKEGVWMEPSQAVLRRRTKEARTDKHRNVTRKLVVEGGWVQKSFYDHWLV